MLCGSCYSAQFSSCMRHLPRQHVDCSPVLVNSFHVQLVHKRNFHVFYTSRSITSMGHVSRAFRDPKRTTYMYNDGTYKRGAPLIICHVVSVLSDAGSRTFNWFGRDVDLGSSQCTVEGKLGVYSIDPVRGVYVLHERDLITSRRTLAGYDGGVSKEELPDL